ncbi:hypothetical protein D3C81_1303290 [compost metagenome]
MRLEREVRRHQPGLALARQALAGNHLIALVVAAAVLRQVFIRRLQGPVRRGVGGKGKEGFVAGLAVVDGGDEAVGEPGRGVEVVGQFDGLAIVAEGRAVIRL